MARMVGLSRNIKPAWLNKCVELVLSGKNERELKEALNEYLAFEIKSKTNLRKTRELLMNIWYYPADKIDSIRELALEAYQDEKANRLALHWCMILLRYPVFVEMTRLIGRINQVQGEFTVGWLKEKLFEAWGERSTLLHSTDKILQMLRDMGVIKRIKSGTYTIQTTRVNDDPSKCVLVKTILALKEKAYYEPAEIMSASAFFPFQFEVDHQWIHEMGCFKLGNFCGNIVLVTE